MIADIFSPVRSGEYVPVTNGVLEMTGAHPRTLATYTRDHVADLSA